MYLSFREILALSDPGPPRTAPGLAGALRAGPAGASAGFCRDVVVVVVLDGGARRSVRGRAKYPEPRRAPPRPAPPRHAAEQPYTGPTQDAVRTMSLRLGRPRPSAAQGQGCAPCKDLCHPRASMRANRHHPLMGLAACYGIGSAERRVGKPGPPLREKARNPSHPARQQPAAARGPWPCPRSGKEKGGTAPPRGRRLLLSLEPNRAPPARCLGARQQGGQGELGPRALGRAPRQAAPRHATPARFHLLLPKKALCILYQSRNPPNIVPGSRLAAVLSPRRRSPPCLRAPRQHPPATPRDSSSLTPHSDGSIQRLTPSIGSKVCSSFTNRVAERIPTRARNLAQQGEEVLVVLHVD